MIIGYCRISCIKAEDNKVIKNESLNNSISNQIRIIKDYIKSLQDANICKLYGFKSSPSSLDILKKE